MLAQGQGNALHCSAPAPVLYHRALVNNLAGGVS
jgi:hypothetical protein